MYADKYPIIFSRQMEATVYIFSRQLKAMMYHFFTLAKFIQDNDVHIPS